MHTDTIILGQFYPLQVRVKYLDAITRLQLAKERMNPYNRKCQKMTFKCNAHNLPDLSSTA